MAVDSISSRPVAPSFSDTEHEPSGGTFLASLPVEGGQTPRALNLPRTGQDLDDADSLLKASGGSPDYLAQRARQDGKVVVTIVDEFKTPLLSPTPSWVPGLGESHGQHVIDSFYDGLSAEQRSHVVIRKIDFSDYRKSDGTVDYAAALRQAEADARSGKTDLINISNEPPELDLYGNPGIVPQDQVKSHSATLQSLTAAAGGGAGITSTTQLNDATRRQTLQGLAKSDPDLAAAIKDLGTLQQGGHKVPVVVAAGNDGFAQAVSLPQGVIVAGARSSLPGGANNSTSPGTFKDATEDGTLINAAYTSFASPRVVRDFYVSAAAKAGLAPVPPQPRFSAR